MRSEHGSRARHGTARAALHIGLHCIWVIWVMAGRRCWEMHSVCYGVGASDDEPADLLVK
eukprot:scaffold26650_cov63-Phaeocystis_antarctica.AAC.9